MDENNILSKYSRSPKIYLDLPSKGRFYQSNPCEKTGTGELPILAMTAKDELIFRTPDALMNGDAVASVVKSCVPMIEDPWDIPSIDMEAILIAIRIATTGEKLKVEMVVPKTEGETLEVEVGLPEILDTMKQKQWNDTFHYEDLTFHVMPLKLRHQNFFDIESFETQRFINVLKDESIEGEKRKKLIQEILDKASFNNIDVVSKQIVKISTPEGEETNPVKITEFLSQSENKLYNAVKQHLVSNREQFDIPAQTVNVPEHILEKFPEAPKTMNVPIFLNNVNFFV